MNKKLKDYNSAKEAIADLKLILKKAENRKAHNWEDQLIISNMVHELDCLLNYENSEGRRNKE